MDFSNAEQQKLNLTWPKYPNQLKEIMQEIIDDEYKDVTLVSDDKQSIKAHRNILSASSPVFKHMLELVTQSSHPVIYLRGIQFLEIESIIKYIYLGKAELLQERMNEFLSAATNLEIRELSTSFVVSRSNNRLDMGQNVNAHNDVTQPSVTESKDKQHEPIDLLNLLEGEEKDPKLLECLECNEVFSDKQNFYKHIKIAHEAIKLSLKPPEIKDKVHKTIELQLEKKISKLQCPECDESYSEEQNLYKHIKTAHYKFVKRHIQSEHDDVKVGSKMQCPQCDKWFSHNSGVHAHIRSVHEGVRYACNQCDYQFTRQDNLTIHIQSVHEGVKLACNQCDKQFTDQSSLAKHIKRKHL